MFRDTNFECLRIIGGMKKAGMPIEAIREYIQLALSGNDKHPTITSSPQRPTSG